MICKHSETLPVNRESAIQCRSFTSSSVTLTSCTPLIGRMKWDLLGLNVIARFRLFPDGQESRRP